MKRTAGVMILLAALGGCSSAQQDSEGNRKVVYDYRQQVPKPADPSWTPNKLASASYGSAPAGYTRVSPTGGAAQANAPATPAAATSTTPVQQPPALLAAPMNDLGSASSKQSAPALPTLESAAATKPAANLLAMKDTLGDPPSLKTTAASSVPNTDGKTADSLGNGPSLEMPPAPNMDSVKDLPAQAMEKAKVLAAPGADRFKELPAPGAIKTKTSEELVTSGYLPGKIPDGLDTHVLNPAVRVINNKRITLNYKINDVGPSGVSSIDVWVTHDSRTWKKLDVGTQTHPPCIVEVSDEGTYGFTLVARNGLGLGKAPPQPGDVPQVWVEVDLSKPVVHLLGVDNSATGKASVIVRWSAADRNLGPKPISLSYSEQGKGTWTNIASNLENTGRYVWPIPSHVTGRFLVRVEATDLAGNIGTAQSQEPVLIDMSQPTIAILNVEGGK
jgi:hypothetical protein